jgi:hypothetical protein
MTGPDAILDAIDGALRDCTVSPDAMRWSPDPEAVVPRKAGAHFSYVIIDEVDWDAVEQASAELRRRDAEFTAALPGRMRAITDRLSECLPEGMRFEWAPGR